MKNKKIKKRSTEAASLKNYTPKIIQSKKREPIVADETDWWYFNDYGELYESDKS